MKKYIGKIEKFDTGLWSYHILVPESVYKALTLDGKKRIICTLNDHDDFHAGFMPDGNGRWFIKLSKDKMKEFGLALGQEVSVKVSKDTSSYGMAIPEVFSELLYQDPEAAAYFEKLSDGKKRSLIYIVDKPKSSEIKLRKAIVILNHLRLNSGKLDFRILNQAIKESNQNPDSLVW